jgi:hypothetical protein
MIPGSNPGRHLALVLFVFESVLFVSEVQRSYTYTSYRDVKSCNKLYTP